MQKKQHCLIVILHLQGQTLISFTLTGSEIACSKYSFGKQSVTVNSSIV